MSESIKVALRDQLDAYIDTWKNILGEVERIYPKQNQSRELAEIISGMNMLLNPGENSRVSEFDPFTRKLTNRLFQPLEINNANEKVFINQCFDQDNKEYAAKLLRFVHMVEFELSSLHYARVARAWIDEDTQHWFNNHFDSALLCDMKALTEKLIALNDARAATEKVFYTHWQYMRNRRARLNRNTIMSSLKEELKKCHQSVVSEQTEDDKILQLRLQTLTCIREQEKGYNEVLASTDKVRLTEPEEKSSWSSIFSPSVKSAAGLTSSELYKFQQSSDYDKVKEHIGKTSGRVVSFYSQVYDVTEKFVKRDKQREKISEALKRWGAQSELLVGQIVNDDSSKRSLLANYYASMVPELERSSTSQRSICHALEDFTIARVGMLVDGNWEEDQDATTQKDAKACLKRENIGRFSRNIAAYKENTKSTRLWMTRINKILVFLGLSGLIYFGIKLAALVLPEKLLVSFPLMKIAGLATLPSSILFAGAAAMCILLLVNWRYRTMIKEAFDDQMSAYHASHNRPKFTIEEIEDQAKPTYWSYLDKGMSFVRNGFTVEKEGASTVIESKSVVSSGNFVIEDEENECEEEVINFNDIYKREGMLRSESFESIDLVDAVERDIEKETENRRGSMFNFGRCSSND